MNAEVKEKWVKALRSGRYKQAEGILQDANGANCCLGVLCRVVRLPSSTWWPDQPNLSEFPEGVELMERVNLTNDQETALIQRNDGYAKQHKHSFSEIADYIEANL